uniref:fibropellin-1-like isoform X2 n=1 Tax=Ciona intestinalis TaxID=7719 RepID=UPI0002B8DFC7|nr:fibropellin-1-like isoform X2 [Ciona intestinalis]|eukprot:XP_002127912.2 fibropellin-1-like isoform X2 [Ciona intestinalis]
MMFRFCFAIVLLAKLSFPLSDGADPFTSENEVGGEWSEIFVRSGATIDDDESEGSGNVTEEFVESRSFYKVDILSRALQPGDCITLQKQLDVVFVLDTRLQRTLDYMKEFTMNTLKIFELGSNKIRVAVTATEGNQIVSLMQGVGHRQVQNLLNNIPTTVNFDVVTALDKARSISTAGARQVRKVIVIVTCAEETRNPRLNSLVSDLRSSGHVIFVVAIGPLSEGTLQILRSVVAQADDFIHVDRIWKLTDLKDLDKRLAETYGCDPCIPNPCVYGSSCMPQADGGLRYRCRCPSGYIGGVCRGTVPCGNTFCTPNEVCNKLGSSMRCINPCKPNPCQHAGVCTVAPTSTGFVNCQCQNGYSGTRCERSIRASQCDGFNCLNGGRCKVNVVSQQPFCECYEIYVGPRCELTPCDNVQCANGGTCVITSTYQPECICAGQFTGPRCTEGNLLCATHACLNGGSCVERPQVGASCLCTLEWTGSNCQQPKPSPCEKLVCKNRGQCKVKSDGTPVCICDHFYIGPTCEQTPCDNYSCFNGGTCVIGSRPSFIPYCVCSSDYSGINCRVKKTNPCATFQCLNGGSCGLNARNQPVCTCTPLFDGQQCQTSKCQFHYSCKNGGVCGLTNGQHLPLTCICPFPYVGADCALTVCQQARQCMNGGSCTYRSGQPQCECPTTHTGSYCETPVLDPCSPNPCQNFGSCTKTSSTTFSCTCRAPFTGPTCIATLCEQRRCLNGGTCRYNINQQPYCSCPPTHSGTSCEILLVNPCSPNPCQNGGTCTRAGSSASSYACTCILPYTGPTCIATLCEQRRCLNGGTCRYNINQQPYCSCPPTHSGTSCEIPLVNPCSPNPCQNGGTCTRTGSSASSYACTCILPYTGPTCIATLCEQRRCLNGGTCRYNINQQPYCSCPPTHSGTSCEIPLVNPCSPNPCQNGGTCTRTGSSASSYACTCILPYTGPTCIATLCEQRRCLNGGTCRYNINQQPYCSCPPTHSGTSCEIPLVNPCSPNPCQNGGTCTRTGSSAASYSCTCPFPYTTVSNCRSEICEQVRCMNGGTCQYRNQQPECACPSTHNGDFCQNQNNVANPCLPNPCLHSGTCSPIPTRTKKYTCQCPTRRTGDRCELTKCNELLPQCLNGGGCKYVNDLPQCACTPPYYGAYCEFRLSCINNPCRRGGRCVPDGPSGWFCRCPRGYGGTTCEIPICLASCMNNGTCVHTSSGPHCECPPGTRPPICHRDPCTPNPCQLGDQCRVIDIGLSPTHVCKPPSSSSNPSEVCSPNPCTSPCVCKPSCKHTNGFVCESEQGYMGKTCTIPPPVLDCNSDRITVSVDNRLYTELLGDVVGNAYFYMSPDYSSTPAESCKGTASGNPLKYYFTLPRSFSACGTETGTTTLGDIIVSNKIWFNIGGNALFDMPVPVLSFQCTFQENYQVVASLEPVVDKQTKIVRGNHERTFTGSLQMCKMLSQCPAACPPSYIVQPNGVYTVGEDLNIVIQHNREIVPTGSTLSVQTLYISCSSDPTSDAVVAVVTNGCPTNVIPSAIFVSPGSTCVTFQVQRLLSCNKVYIHARLNVCSVSAQQICSTSPSVRKCPSNQRGRRSIQEEEVFGPLFILPERKIPIEKPAEVENFDAKNLILISLLGVLAVFVLIASVFLLVSLYRSYRKNNYSVSGRSKRVH